MNIIKRRACRTSGCSGQVSTLAADPSVSPIKSIIRNCVLLFFIIYNVVISSEFDAKLINEYIFPMNCMSNYYLYNIGNSHFYLQHAFKDINGDINIDRMSTNKEIGIKEILDGKQNWLLKNMILYTHNTNKSIITNIQNIISSNYFDREFNGYDCDSLFYKKSFSYMSIKFISIDYIDYIFRGKYCKSILIKWEYKSKYESNAINTSEIKSVYVKNIGLVKEQHVHKDHSIDYEIILQEK